MATFSNEQLQAILGMGDYGAEESELDRQQALADELRKRSQGGRMDWASQLGRGISGIAGGYMAGKAAQAEQALGQKRKGFLQGLFGPKSYGDEGMYTGFGGGTGSV